MTKQIDWCMADKATDRKSEVWRSLRHNLQAQVWGITPLITWRREALKDQNVTCSHEMSLNLKFAI